jgi:hypothetical protein
VGGIAGISLASDWYGGTLYQIRVENPAGVKQGVQQVTLDGEDAPGEAFTLMNDSEQHEVRILMAGQVGICVG